MKDSEQKKLAKTFAEQWKDKGYEKGESQAFWLQLLSDVFGIENASQFIRFEDTVHIDKTTGFIDALGISHTRLTFNTPSIRFSLQRRCTRRADMPQSSAASCAVIYSNISDLLKHAVIIIFV